jgi:hypothetical protein
LLSPDVLEEMIFWISVRAADTTDEVSLLVRLATAAG